MDLPLVSVPVEGGCSELIVPGRFFAYRALDSAERGHSVSRRSLIRFGLFGRATSVFIDEDSGEVLWGLAADDLVLVNSSVAQFTDCMCRLADAFPFYSANSDHDEWETASQRVQDLVCGIDPAAYFEGSLWYEFRWDVSMGDFHE
ncbi:SUKH-4 family immunity protein [Streptomyces sp. NPDC050704]|uniref:SUKH-4 family immunity protein n=1 Tax=Streptomyces sp. NPDC050704 TaxID=3157219 RepID=UPI0034312AEA